jgi:hypothetical protein
MWGRQLEEWWPGGCWRWFGSSPLGIYAVSGGLVEWLGICAAPEQVAVWDVDTLVVPRRSVISRAAEPGSEEMAGSDGFSCFSVGTSGFRP